jgi:hypothetical protein
MRLKVRVLVVVPRILNWSPIVVSTVLPGNSHTRVGLSTRYSSKRAMQVMVSWPPASIAYRYSLDRENRESRSLESCIIKINVRTT